MTNQHSITPPPEMVQQWWEEADQDCDRDDPKNYFDYIATQAARWGADQELWACCEQLVQLVRGDRMVEFLRAARRPKPPSLKEQALAVLDHTPKGWGLAEVDLDTIRRALESLPD